MRAFSLSAPCLSSELSASVTITDDGVCVLLTGGHKPHVGAVSLSDTAGAVQTIQLPGHRDGVVSEQWAKSLSASTHSPVSVTCGIHFNNASKAEIVEILDVCDKLLQDCIQKELHP